MPASKIVDEAEVLRWFEEGKSYAWMTEEYERKYNVSTTPTMWGNFRRRRGLSKRIVRNDDLIPWEVEERHRWAYPVVMLRTEARRRAGSKLTEADKLRLEAWLSKMGDDDLVVHYNPNTGQGFFYVKRRPNIDKDLIREPGHKTTRQPSEGK